MAVLPKRMQRFGLTLHPEKTRLVPFRRPPRTRKRGQGPGTFDFLGFTLYWRRTRGGRWQLAFKTRRARLERAIQRVHDFCRRHRHRPVPEQHKGLMRRLRGALQLLRGERQHPQLADAGERRGACLVQMAESPQPAIAPHQEAISGPPHGLPDTATSDRGPGVGHVALRDMVAEEPDGGNLLVRFWRGAGRVTGRPTLLTECPPRWPLTPRASSLIGRLGPPTSLCAPCSRRDVTTEDGPPVTGRCTEARCADRRSGSRRHGLPGQRPSPLPRRYLRRSAACRSWTACRSSGSMIRSAGIMDPRFRTGG